LSSVCASAGTFADVAGAVDQALLPQRAGKDLLQGADQPGGGVADGEQGWAQPTALQLVQEVRPGISGLTASRCQPDQDRSALGGDAPRGQYRFGASPVVHLEERTVQEQVVQRQVAQGSFGPAGELGLDGPADPRDRRLAQHRLSAERIGQRGLHVPVGQATDVPGDDQRLQRVGLGHPGAEQSRGELLGRPAQLGAGNRDRPGGGLDRCRTEPVPAALAGVLGGGDALVAGAAEELGDLCFDRGLDDQAGTQAGDLLQGLGQVDALGEQGIDLMTDLLGGRYSYGHGRGSFLGSLAAIEANLRPLSFTPRLGRDPGLGRCRCRL